MLAFLIKISAIIAEGDFVAARSLQLNAKLSVLFTDSPFEERFTDAARADFRGIACLPRWEREFREGVEQ